WIITSPIKKSLRVHYTQRDVCLLFTCRTVCEMQILFHHRHQEPIIALVTDSLYGSSFATFILGQKIDELPHMRDVLLIRVLFDDPAFSDDIVRNNDCSGP